MALGTRHAQAKKHLGGVVHELLSVLELLVPDGRRRLDLIADCAEDLAGELVVRLVGGDRLADPLVEGERAVSPAGLLAALDAEDVGPLVGEVVAVVG